jgi:hypothetical protein
MNPHEFPAQEIIPGPSAHAYPPHILVHAGTAFARRRQGGGRAAGRPAKGYAPVQAEARHAHSRENRESDDPVRKPWVCREKSCAGRLTTAETKNRTAVLNAAPRSLLCPRRRGQTPPADEDACPQRFEEGSDPIAPPADASACALLRVEMARAPSEQADKWRKCSGPMLKRA